MADCGLVNLFSWHVELLGLYIGFELDYWRPSRSTEATFNVRIERGAREPIIESIKEI